MYRLNPMKKIMKMILTLFLLIILSCKATNEKITQEEFNNDPIENNNPDSTYISDHEGTDSSNIVVGTDVSNGEDNTTDRITSEFITLVNNHRNNLGLKSIKLLQDLSYIATEHSLNMANKTVDFGHDGFSERCEEGKNIIGGSRWCGENVAMGQLTAKNVFNAWLNSSGHRANIERAKTTHTGFGYAKNDFGQPYWTQIFFEAN